SPQLVPRAGFPSATCHRSIAVLAALIAAFCVGTFFIVACIDARDLPGRPGAWKLHQRRVGRVDDSGPPVGAAWIAYRAVVHQVGRAVRPEADRGRTVDAVHLARERLVALARALRGAVRIVALIALLAIERKARELQLALALEVDELDIMAGGRVAVLGREAEIALARQEHRVLPHHAAHERRRCEIEPD